MVTPEVGPSKTRSFVVDLIAGGSSAAVARTIVAPIDRVKILLQLQHAQQTIDKEKRWGESDRVREKTLQIQGHRGLLRAGSK